MNVKMGAPAAKLQLVLKYLSDTVGKTITPIRNFQSQSTDFRCIEDRIGRTWRNVRILTGFNGMGNALDTCKLYDGNGKIKPACHSFVGIMKNLMIMDTKKAGYEYENGVRQIPCVGRGTHLVIDDL